MRIDGRVHRGDFTLSAHLAAAPREFLVIVGPNGSGKSTLLGLAAGLLALNEGAISFAGQVWDDAQARTFLPAQRRPVALAFQDYRLFPHLSALQNVAFPIRAAGQKAAQARSEAQGWLDRLGVSSVGRLKPASLSGGQSQRVALARALASRPAALLLDEPLAALDSTTRLDVRAGLRGHVDHVPGPVLMVTHDAVDALVLADRIVVLERGRIVQVGTPAEVSRRPRTEYVARLVGLNLYAGTVGPDGHRIDLQAGGHLVVADSPGPVGTRVHVVLRPSTITVQASRPDQASARNIWPGRIRELEVVGERVRAVVDGAPEAIVDLTPASVADLELRPNVEVWLTAKATDIDAFTG
ncbi:MAG: ABC transporter ATP-binding protein [Nostocoides sp.]